MKTPRTTTRYLDKGDVAPDFCLPDEFGENICLKDLKGKWVIVYFYPKDNTPGCTQEAKEFSCVLKDFERNNTVVLGVSADDAESHQKFRLKHDLTVKLLSDPDKKVMKEYNAWGEKEIFGSVSMGIIRSSYLIDPEGRIAWLWPTVKVSTHVEEVIAKLDELQRK